MLWDMCKPRALRRTHSGCKNDAGGFGIFGRRENHPSCPPGAFAPLTVMKIDVGQPDSLSGRDFDCAGEPALKRASTAPAARALSEPDDSQFAASRDAALRAIRP